MIESLMPDAHEPPQYYEVNNNEHTHCTLCLRFLVLGSPGVCTRMARCKPWPKRRHRRIPWHRSGRPGWSSSPTSSIETPPPPYQTRINGYRLRRCSRVHQLGVPVKTELQERCSISELLFWTHGTLTSVLGTSECFQLVTEAKKSNKDIYLTSIN
ncbi:hypothetical protein V5799_011285 [Amblyomma americanum]|uniref:Uncharacterized protein n=1 Tax=Amblyomma americanum TaxID=6943 RepID=A0AAQ4EHK2_AMBAM